MSTRQIFPGKWVSRMHLPLPWPSEDPKFPRFSLRCVCVVSTPFHVEKVDTQFVLPSSFDINEVTVPAKYRIEWIEGYDLSRIGFHSLQSRLPM